MTWELFYLVCFVVGLVLTLISFASGALHFHLPGHHHLPHFRFHGSAGGHGVGMHGAGAAAPHVGAHGAPGAPHGGSARAGISPFNMFSIVAFLAWFGGTGYLLSHYSALVAAATLVISSLTGLLGGAVIFYFMAKVLLPHDRPLDPADYDMLGVLGMVSGTIAPGRMGEIHYVQAGTRRACAAQGETGILIAKGAEVVVTRFERGIAFVRPWDELSDGGRQEQQLSKGSEA